MKINKKIIIFACILVIFACTVLIFSFGISEKRTYIGRSIGKEQEIKDIAITTEEHKVAEIEIAKKQQEEFLKERERIEKEHEAIKAEMQEEFLKEMKRIEKKHRDFEEEHLTESKRGGVS